MYKELAVWLYWYSQGPHLLPVAPHTTSNSMVVAMSPSVHSGSIQSGWWWTASLSLSQAFGLPCLSLAVAGVLPSLWTTVRCTPLRSQLPSVGTTVILLCCELLRVSSMQDAWFHQMTESHVHAVHSLSIHYFFCCWILGLGSINRFHNSIADCGPPTLFPNGTVIYENTTEGSQAYYHCDGGFTLEGNFTAVCAADGNWSSTPICGKSESGTKYNIIFLLELPYLEVCF